MDTNLIDSRSRLSWVCFVTPSVTPWCSRQSTLLCGIALSAASNWFWNTIISVITPYMIGEDQSQIQRLLPVGQSLQVCVCLLPCTRKLKLMALPLNKDLMFEETPHIFKMETNHNIRVRTCTETLGSPTIPSRHSLFAACTSFFLSYIYYFQKVQRAITHTYYPSPDPLIFLLTERSLKLEV